jgi:hypothetical protein
LSLEGDLVDDADDLGDLPRLLFDGANRIRGLDDNLARARGAFPREAGHLAGLPGQLKRLAHRRRDLGVGRRRLLQGRRLALGLLRQRISADGQFIGRGGDVLAGLTDLAHGAGELVHGEIEVHAQALVPLGEELRDVVAQLALGQGAQVISEALHHGHLFGLILFPFRFLGGQLVPEHLFSGEVAQGLHHGHQLAFVVAHRAGVDGEIEALAIGKVAPVFGVRPAGDGVDVHRTVGGGGLTAVGMTGGVQHDIRQACALLGIKAAPVVGGPFHSIGVKSGQFGAGRVPD